MPFNNDALYILETVGNIHYTNVPTGNIALERALEGANDCWISPILSREKKQKQLIVSDWTAPYWTDKKRTQIIGRFETLLREGFHVYMWFNRTLKPLTQENVQKCFEKEACTSIKPAYPEDIYQVALAQSITAEHIYLFDDYHIELLYQDNNTLPYTVHLSHLISFNRSNRGVTIIGTKRYSKQKSLSQL